MKRLLMLLLCCVVLVGFAIAVSSPMLTDEARTAHLAEAPADDEYAFLFD